MMHNDRCLCWTFETYQVLGVHKAAWIVWAFLGVTGREDGVPIYHIMQVVF